MKEFYQFTKTITVTGVISIDTEDKESNWVNSELEQDVKELLNDMTASDTRLRNRVTNKGILSEKPTDFTKLSTKEEQDKYEVAPVDAVAIHYADDIDSLNVWGAFQPIDGKPYQYKGKDAKFQVFGRDIFGKDIMTYYARMMFLSHNVRNKYFYEESTKTWYVMPYTDIVTYYNLSESEEKAFWKSKWEVVRNSHTLRKLNEFFTASYEMDDILPF